MENNIHVDLDLSMLHTRDSMRVTTVKGSADEAIDVPNHIKLDLWVYYLKQSV